MSPTLNPLITQPLSPVAKCSVSECSVWFQSGDYILSCAAYLKISPVKKKQKTSPSQQTQTLTNTHKKKCSSICNSSPFPFSFTGASFNVLILLVPQLACFPRTRCIFRFVKSVKMPVMNISTALSVFNVLFDQPNKNQVLIWHWGPEHQVLLSWDSLLSRETGRENEILINYHLCCAWMYMSFVFCQMLKKKKKD